MFIKTIDTNNPFIKAIGVSYVAKDLAYVLTDTGFL